MAKRYATQPIARALQLHQENGAITEYSEPKSNGGGTTRWLITISGYGTEELTSAQAWALCLGLAAGKRAYSALEMGST